MAIPPIACELYQHGRLKAILQLSGQISELPERLAGTTAGLRCLSVGPASKAALVRNPLDHGTFALRNHSVDGFRIP
jgi:hypothetical protein